VTEAANDAAGDANMTTMTLITFLALPFTSLVQPGPLAPGASTTIDLVGTSELFSTVTLEQGCYLVKPVAGKAWNPFNSAPLRCKPDGSGCAKGYTTNFQVKADGFTDSANLTRGFSAPSFWSSAALAEKNGATGYFCLSTTQSVGFRVWDSTYGDNQEGLSLMVTRSAC
jgi:hypothetical protein